MKIKVGKYYLDADGVTRGPIRRPKGCFGLFDYEGAIGYFTINGLTTGGDDANLVSKADVSPIRTRHVGTIAFQGTDAQINETMQRYFGERK